MYIRIASNDFFAISKDVVSKMIAGEYTAKQAYRAFNTQLLAEDTPADDEIVLTSGKGYSNAVSYTHLDVYKRQQKSFISAHKRHTPLFVDWKIVFANIQSLSYPLFRFLTTFFAHKTIKTQRFNSFPKEVHAKDVSVCRCDPGCKKASQQRPQALLRCRGQNILSPGSRPCGVPR